MNSIKHSPTHSSRFLLAPIPEKLKSKSMTNLSMSAINSQVHTTLSHATFCLEDVMGINKRPDLKSLSELP